MSHSILDQEEEELEVLGEHLTPNISGRTVGYLGIMLLSGAVAYYLMYPMASLIVHVLGALILIIIPTLISLVLESFRYLFRKRREKKSGQIERRNPFCCEVVEGGFSIWLLIAGLMALNYFVLN